MNALSPLEAYDVICHSAQLQDRLSAALGGLAKKQGLKREKEWLSGAVELVHGSRESLTGLIERSLKLPELAAVRQEQAVALQERWVDALERLLAGITFHAGSRAPLIEALFPRLKLPALRRAKREAVDAYRAELEKRIGGGYSKRMLGQEAFAFVLPVIEEVRAAFTAWSECFSAATLPAEEAEGLRAELAGAAQKLELPIRQAKLLGEAALCAVQGAFEGSGIGLKPRKRTGKATAATEPGVAIEAAATAEPAAELPAPAPSEPSEAVAKPARKRRKSGTEPAAKTA